MMKIKAIILSLIFVFNFSSVSNSQNIPNSFADLAEKLMPSVVNISTTQTVVERSNPFPNFQFPPGSPFGDMFKEFGTPQERQSSALGSGFIIDKEGIVQHQIVNNLPLGRNVDEALRMVDALQHHEEEGEVCPANWEKGKEAMKENFAGVADYLSKH